MANVTNYDELSSFADAVKSENGEIDIWINNAGSNQLKDLMDYSVDEFKHMVDTDLIPESLVKSRFSGIV
ncbi:SDR family NAD(P)-dependent oxidoreductase [Oscillospiraceae bacterium LTW-04]|nr:SDR family oxidoreductase [Eubacteriales bacterium]WMJ84812.1 SDR family oxidoreductase [Oscillospiraceae bacterium MB24-C1]